MCFHLLCVYLTRHECRGHRRRRCRGGQSSRSPVFYCITTYWWVSMSSSHMSWQFVYCWTLNTHLFFFSYTSLPPLVLQAEVWCIFFHDCWHSKERCFALSSLCCTFLSLPYRSACSRRAVEYCRWITEPFKIHEHLMKRWQRFPIITFLFLLLHSVLWESVAPSL